MNPSTVWLEERIIRIKKRTITEESVGKKHTNSPQKVEINFRNINEQSLYSFG